MGVSLSAEPDYLSWSNQYLTQGAISLCAWVMFDDVVDTYNTLDNLSSDASSFQPLGIFNLRSSGNKLQFIRNNSGSTGILLLTSSGNLTAGVLTHICAVQITDYSGTMSLYINGAFDSSGGAGNTYGLGANRAAKFRIGCAADAFYFMKGDVWDARYYQRALTEDEIKTIYNSRGKDNIGGSLVFKGCLGKENKLNWVDGTMATITGTATYVADVISPIRDVI